MLDKPVAETVFQVCNKPFARKDVLAKHLKFHTEEEALKQSDSLVRYRRRGACAQSVASLHY